MFTGGNENIAQMYTSKAMIGCAKLNKIWNGSKRFTSRWCIYMYIVSSLDISFRLPEIRKTLTLISKF